MLKIHDLFKKKKKIDFVNTIEYNNKIIILVISKSYVCLIIFSAFGIIFLRRFHTQSHRHREPNFPRFFPDFVNRKSVTFECDEKTRFDHRENDSFVGDFQRSILKKKKKNFFTHQTHPFPFARGLYIVSCEIRMRKIDFCYVSSSFCYVDA